MASTGLVYLIASGAPGFDIAGGLASNGYGEHSPGKYSMLSGLVCEVVMTAMFLVVILGVTHHRAPTGFAGLVIGLSLTLIHLISIPVTNTSVNPAQHQAHALFVGGWALQLLAVLVAIVGVIGGLVHIAQPCGQDRRSRTGASPVRRRALPTIPEDVHGRPVALW